MLIVIGLIVYLLSAQATEYSDYLKNETENNLDKFKIAYIRQAIVGSQQPSTIGKNLDLSSQIGNQFKVLADAQKTIEMKQAYMDQWKEWKAKATGKSSVNTEDSGTCRLNNNQQDLNMFMQDVYRKNAQMGNLPKSEENPAPTYRSILEETISSMFGANQAVASESRGSVDWTRMDQAILIAKAKLVLLKLANAQETLQMRKSYWKQFNSWLEAAKETIKLE